MFVQKRNLNQTQSEGCSVRVGELSWELSIPLPQIMTFWTLTPLHVHLLPRSPLVQFNLLHSKFHLCSVPTRALLLSAYIKFINLFPEIKTTIQDVLRSDSQLRNADVELQQRAVEYLRLSCIASTDILVRQPSPFFATTALEIAAQTTLSSFYSLHQVFRMGPVFKNLGTKKCHWQWRSLKAWASVVFRVLSTERRLPNT